MRKLLYERTVDLSESTALVVDVCSIDREEILDLYPAYPIDDLDKEKKGIDSFFLCEFFKVEKEKTQEAKLLFTTISLLAPTDQDLILASREIFGMTDEEIAKLAEKPREFNFDHRESNRYSSKYKLTTKLLQKGNKKEGDLWYDLYYIDDTYKVVYYLRDAKTGLCYSVVGEMGFNEFPSELDIKTEMAKQAFKDFIKSFAKAFSIFIVYMACFLLVLLPFLYVKNKYPETVYLIMTGVGFLTVAYLAGLGSLKVAEWFASKINEQDKLDQTKNEKNN